MLLHVLNTNLLSIAVIDNYESLVWTDRYNKCGDFELFLPIGNEIPWYIKQEYILTCEESEHAMIIEGIEIKSDVDEGSHLIVTGRSLESMLDRRIIWGYKNLSCGVQDGIETLLNENAIIPTNEKRMISNLVFKRNEDRAVANLSFEAQYKCENLLEVIEKICIDCELGFKITFNEHMEFVFELYAGANRTYNQVDNPYVVFSSEFDNIINSNYLSSTVTYKNVTLVMGEGEPDECMTVTVGNDEVYDLARREFFTDASDISQGKDSVDYDSTETESPSMGYVTLHPVGGGSPEKEHNHIEQVSPGLTVITYCEEHGFYPSAAAMALSLDEEAGISPAAETTNEPLTDEEYKALLVERGTEELVNHIYTDTFEGEVNTDIMYRYGEHFYMGDIVQFANEYGQEATVRVIEYVMSHDESGFSAYPSFESVVIPEPR